jgi:hypothetical protein
LQQDLQRFTGNFFDGIVDAADPLVKSHDPALREAALRRVLLYSSSSLDIATGPLVQTNLLDMVVFVELSQSVLERYWIPRVFHEQGRALLDAFATARQNVWSIAAKVATPAQQEQLREMIRVWLAEHPDQIRVDTVRFSDFAVVAGQVAEERARAVGGLFGSVKAATSAADRALLLAERSMFVAHHIPFLVRLQARIGTQEIVDDSLSRFHGLEAVLEEAKDMQPLAHELGGLLVKSQAAAHEALELVQAMQPIVEYATQRRGDGKQGTSLDQTLDASNRLVDKTLNVLDRADKLNASAQQSLAHVDDKVDHLLKKVAFYAILIGAAWAIFLWGGYYLVKRHAAAPTPRPIQVVAQAPAPGPAEPHRALRVRPYRPTANVAPHARRYARRNTPAQRDRDADRT